VRVPVRKISAGDSGRERQSDVVDKPNGQSRACADYAMARKRLLETNRFVKPSAEPNLFGLCRGEKTKRENQRFFAELVDIYYIYAIKIETNRIC
jgi:hypothetical protein